MKRDIYPIDTQNPTRVVALDAENAVQYATAFVHAGVDFSMQYVNTLPTRRHAKVQEQIDKVEVWVFESQGSRP